MSARSRRLAEEPDPGQPCAMYGAKYVSFSVGQGDGRVAVAVRVCPSHLLEVMATVACLDAALSAQDCMVTVRDIPEDGWDRCEWMRGARP